MAQTAVSAAQLPPVAARAWLLLDYRTGRVIASRGGDERIEPASLTKLMTAYLAFTALKQEVLFSSQVLPVSAKATKMPGSRMFIATDKAVTVDELLHGVIVQSGNDATRPGGRHLRYRKVAVQRMNEQAARLGMTHTHFANATGLADPHHYSTVAICRMLAVALIRDYPEYFPMTRSVVHASGITQRNRNEPCSASARGAGRLLHRAAGSALSQQRSIGRRLAVVGRLRGGARWRLRSC
jgi:D-alanyl-D-alanine carboxypeptidase (penicillin-binding protein 5/6)